MSLSVVKPTEELPDTARFINERLEAETIGIPLWLYENGYHQEAVQAMRIIGEFPHGTFVRRPHSLLHTTYDILSRLNQPSSPGQVSAGLTNLDGWTEDETDRSRVSPGLLNELQEMGCMKHTMRLDDSVERPLRENLEHLAELRRKRHSIAHTEDLLRTMYIWNPGTDGAVAAALDELNQCVAERYGKRERAVSLGQLVSEDLDALERQANGEEPRRVMTGFNGLDTALGGMLPGNVIVVAGRPGTGKTAIGLDVALNVAQQGHPAAYFSMEMRRTEIMRRIASKQARIDVLKMRHGRLQDWELDVYRNAGAELEGLPLWIDDGDSHTPATIEARTRDLNRTGGRIELIVIDHLGLLAGSNESRYALVTAHTAATKRMARALDATVLLLCQLNRNIANRDDKTPRLSDLRDSGSIEQDADVVLGLYRKFLDTANEDDRNHAEVFIMKNRSGPTGVTRLTWAPSLAKFTNPVHEDAPF